MAWLGRRLLDGRTDLAGRHARALLDQLVSSGGNFVIAVFIAHAVSARTFGVYAILASIYWLALGGTRALVGEPLLILRASLVGVDPFVDRMTAGLGLAIGLTAAVPLASVGLLLHQPAFTVLGLALPALLWQDAMRYVCFARKRPGYALASDLVWLIAEVAAGVALGVRGMSSLGAWMSVWAGAGAVAAVALAVTGRIAPRLRGAGDWLRRAGSTSSQMFADFFVTVGAQQIIVFALPVVSSLSVLGALKAAQVAIGPLSVLITSAAVLAIPGIADVTRQGRPDLAVRRGGLVALLLFLAGALYLAIVVVVPESWGVRLFHDSWIRGSRLVGYVTCQFALTGLISGAVIVLRGTRNTRRSLIVRLFVTPLNVAIPIVGAWTGGIRGLGVGLVVTASVGAIVWWSAAWGVGRRGTSLSPSEALS